MFKLAISFLVGILIYKLLALILGRNTKNLFLHAKFVLGRSIVMLLLEPN